MKIVQKFGGTSVGSLALIQNVAKKIKKSAEHHQVAVVVSAMAGETDRLLSLAQSAGTIPSEHSAREIDALLASGEQVSASLLCLTLQSLGIKAQSFLSHQLPIRTDSRHRNASITDFDATKINEALKQGIVPVVAGFQGADEAQNITTLGRGGSDTTAIALAHALGADACHIYTDVEGVYTADPRIVPNARALETIDMLEMLALSSMGARVMQARAIMLAQKFSMPLHVYSSFHKASGTLIIPTPKDTQSNTPTMEQIKITALSTKEPCAAYTLQDHALEKLPQILAQDMAPYLLQQQNTPHGAQVYLLVDRDDAPKIDALLFDAGKAYHCEPNLGILSLIGTGINHKPEIIKKATELLQTSGINPEGIFVLETKLTFTLRAHETQNAAQILHEAFIEESIH